MGRSKRGVRFPNRNGNANGSDGRRSSFSDMSEDGQSPSKLRAQLATVDEKSPTVDEKNAEYEKKKANFITRTFWTFVMFGLFFSALFMGHIYIICIITAIQIISFKEVIAIANVPSRARSLRSTKSLNWYWLATTMYFLYGETVIYYFKHIVLVDKVLLPLATHHRFISFILYVFGFVFFVTSLQAGNYKFQFTNFAWTHMALYLIVVQAHFIMNNVFEGMIWFFLPAALVITNDIFAYICGIAFGRTQLIKLSPKKTVEGFVGAWIMTIVFGVLLVNIMMRSKYFICPVNDLGANIFTGLRCDPNPVFLPKTYQLPEFFFLPQKTNLSVTVAPMQLHALNLATFASLIAPFGGFFASGLKRTFKLKDFGDSIPGHGGITDRMDCQFIMGFFAYMYFHTFIALHKVNVGTVLETAITSLSPEEQVELVKSMGHYLSNQGIMPENFFEYLEKFTPLSKPKKRALSRHFTRVERSRVLISMASRLWASRVASHLRISVFHRGFASVVKDLKYADSHEWAKIDGNSATIGITDHAQDHLGDVVYVELPEVGATVTQGSSFGAVESVKATSDINSPVSGEVVEVNEELNSSPGLVNASPYENGWIIKVEMSNAGDVNSLMDSDQYSKFCEDEDAKH